MVETFFTNPLFMETVLPLVLVFTLVFAVLQKTKILGENKRQIDAIVALVIALIFVAFGKETNIVVKMIPILAIALVVILIFMLLLGSLYEPGKFKMPDWLKIVIGILIGILVITTVLIRTGGLDLIINFFYEDNSSWIVNGIVILIIAGAIFAVIFGGKGSSGGSSDKK